MRLIVIAGPPGVGKSAVAARLLSSLDKSVWLDGDDVWRMHPFRNTPEMQEMALRNCKLLLDSFTQEDFDSIVFTWVLHKDSLVEDLIAGVSGLCSKPYLFSLVCDEVALRKRIANDPGKQRDVELALTRLEQVNSLTLAHRIDTTGKDISAVVQEIQCIIAPEHNVTPGA